VIVPCVSAQAQRVFRTGYEPRSVDVHDLTMLDELEDRQAPIEDA
jgi:hypothetical protein